MVVAHVLLGLSLFWSVCWLICAACENRADEWASISERERFCAAFKSSAPTTQRDYGADTRACDGTSLHVVGADPHARAARGGSAPSPGSARSRSFEQAGDAQLLREKPAGSKWAGLHAGPYACTSACPSSCRVLVLADTRAGLLVQEVR